MHILHCLQRDRYVNIVLLFYSFLSYDRDCVIRQKAELKALKEFKSQVAGLTAPTWALQTTLPPNERAIDESTLKFHINVSTVYVDFF